MRRGVLMRRVVLYAGLYGTLTVHFNLLLNVEMFPLLQRR